MNSNRTIPSYKLYISDINNNCLSAKTCICRDIGYGGIIWYLYTNWASIYFIYLTHSCRMWPMLWSLYLLRNMKYEKILLFIIIATAFLDLWSQISFWGATALTNLSAMPFISISLVEWIWGGLLVSKSMHLTLHLSLYSLMHSWFQP